MPNRFVVVHRHFWPDTPPYASMLRAIAGRWRAEGAAVTVLTAQPSYRSATGIERRPHTEHLDNMTVRRYRVVDEAKFQVAKLANMIVFPAQVAAGLLTGGRPSVVMCSTAPQVTLGVAASLAAKIRGAKFIYHCMDLHPEIGRLSGEFRNPIIYRILMSLDAATMRRSDAVVVLSEDMRRAVLNRDPSLGDRVRVLNNFALPDFDGAVASDPPLPTAPDATLRICFTGNLGRFQRLSEVVRALIRADRDIELVFMGDGRAKSALEQLARELDPEGKLRVIFLPHGTSARARALMSESHLGLVSLEPEVIRYAYPSKTATYLSERLPVLVLCDKGSELARTVNEAAIGWAATNEGELTSCVRQAASHLTTHGDLEEYALRAQRYGAAHFSEDVILAHWQRLAHDLLGERSHAHV